MSPYISMATTAYVPNFGDGSLTVSDQPVKGILSFIGKIFRIVGQSGDAFKSVEFADGTRQTAAQRAEISNALNALNGAGKLLPFRERLDNATALGFRLGDTVMIDGKEMNESICASVGWREQKRFADGDTYLTQKLLFSLRATWLTAESVQGVLRKESPVTPVYECWTEAFKGFIDEYSLERDYTVAEVSAVW